jgi:hypothetical protein
MVFHHYCMTHMHTHTNTASSVVETLDIYFDLF